MTAEVTTGEVARGLEQLRTQQVLIGATMANLTSELSALRADVRELTTALKAHVDRQAERTRNRDRELDAVRASQVAARQEHAEQVAELRADHDRDVAELRASQRSTDQWRWTTTGRMAAIVALAGGGTSGIVLGIAKATSGG